MASYWRSLLHSARAFGAQRPAAVLLGTAALSAGVWAASVRVCHAGENEHTHPQACEQPDTLQCRAAPSLVTRSSRQPPKP